LVLQRKRVNKVTVFCPNVTQSHKKSATVGIIQFVKGFSGLRDIGLNQKNYFFAEYCEGWV